MSSPPPPTVTPNQILGVIGNAVNVQTPPPPPPTVTSTQVQVAAGGGGINVGVFTDRERAFAAINLSYFVGAIMTLVILLVFIDYLAHVPSTPGSEANNQPAQLASPTPTAPTPQPTPATQRTAEAQQTTFMREAAFSQTQTAQAVTPAAPQPTGDASPSPAKTAPPASPASSPQAQVVAPKTEADNFVSISNAVAERSSKMFDLVVSRALLPVFTALLGYIFASQSRSNS
jgi:hypothetical protein